MGAESHIILVPFPAHGHVTPMLQLAQVLRTCGGYRPIVAVLDFAVHRDHKNSEVELFVLSTGVKEARAKDFAVINEAMETEMPPQLGTLLEKMKGTVACVVVDLLASWAIEVAAEKDIAVAGFWPAMLATYRIVSAIPELIRRGVISELGIPVKQKLPKKWPQKDTEELILPGNRAKLKTKDLPWLVGNPSSALARFKFWTQVVARTKSLQWIIVNSFPDLQSMAPPPPDVQPISIFSVGPLLSPNKNIIHNQSSWLTEWLERQKPNSVIYVSFGTWVAPLPPQTITELALGLESTELPFLWVLKDEDEWRTGLPEGYIDRVFSRGRVVSWVQQEEVLRHEAIGCYITHCGWNSTVEAIRYGKRMLCYPIAGDQFATCDYIVRVWGIGMEIGGLRKKVVSDRIKRVMTGFEGEEIQRRVLQFREAVMGEEGRLNARKDLQGFIECLRKNSQKEGRGEEIL